MTVDLAARLTAAETDRLAECAIFGSIGAAAASGAFRAIPSA